MKITLKQIVMSAIAAAVAVSCVGNGGTAIPSSVLEECVYKGDKTEFSVWAPGAEAAQVSLYQSAMDKEPFLTLDMRASADGLWKAVVKDFLPPDMTKSHWVE